MSHDRWKKRNPIAEVYSRNRLIEFIKRYQDRLDLPPPVTAAGSDTQIQYNDAGSFGASADLTFDGSILECTASAAFQVGTGGVHVTGAAGVTLFDVQPAGASGVPTFCTVDTDVGLSTAAPKIHLDVNHGYLDWLTSDTGGGESVRFGSGATVAGKLYYLNSSGAWTVTNATAVASGATQLLAIALGTDSTVHGMLLRGFFQMTSYLQGTWDEGIPVYISRTDAGEGDIDAPTTSGDFVRVIGYCGAGTTDLIYFNPSSTYIEIT
jgi:hypothetical protein